MKRVVAMLALCACAPGAEAEMSADGGAEPPAPPPACQTDLNDWLDELRVPGLSAAIVREGELACTAVAGAANLEDERPVAPETMFTWASVSKTVTATALMILRDDGLLHLDDAIDDHLPFRVRNPNCPNKAITFRQLLSHTSSIADNDRIYFDAYVQGDSPVGLGDFVESYLVDGGKRFKANKNFVDACPGKEVEYSNVAVGLIGHLVERIAGVPFDDFCRARIFEPLEMGDASFHLANLDESQLAMPYTGNPSRGFKAHGHFGFPTHPDGLMRASAPHLARMLAMMTNDGVHVTTQVLAPGTVAEILTRQVPDLDRSQGLIWYYDYDGLVGHDGGDPGTSSLMFFDPKTGAGALVVANGEWPEAKAGRLLRALMDEAQAP